MPMGDRLLALAAALGEPEAGGGMSRVLGQRKICGMLARLVEETGRCGKPVLRGRALDAWDRLIEAEVPFAVEQIDRRLQEAD